MYFRERRRDDREKNNDAEITARFKIASYLLKNNGTLYGDLGLFLLKQLYNMYYLSSEDYEGVEIKEIVLCKVVSAVQAYFDNTSGEIESQKNAYKFF